MSKKETKKKLVGPWRNLHGAVWLIGLAVLAWQDWWWPGILVLVAISMVIEAAIMQFAPHAYEVEKSEETPQEQTPPAAPAPAPAAKHRQELLPLNCPKCGGPIRGHDVVWTGAQSADCPYCGINLPMKG